MNRWQGALITLAVGLFSLNPTHLPSCGPFPTETVFTYRTFPRFQMDRYVDGDLGVIFPKFWRRFLFVAYRHLAGEPLTAIEQKAFFGERPAGEDPLKRWAEARANVPGVGEAPRLNLYRRVPGSEWQNYRNCGDDAFLNAARTLDARIGTFGAEHDGVKRWVTAQDTVFSNCGGGDATPAGPEDDLPAALTADRRYQIAAAHFYAARLHDAQRHFEQIAEDETSEWRTIAPYLAARCIIRRATLDPRPGHVDLDLLSRAAARLHEIVPVYPAAKGMLDHIAFRLEPGRRLVRVSGQMRDPANESGFWRNLIDFQRPMDNNAGKDEQVRGADDMVDWIVALQAGELEHSLERWRTTGSPAWLVASLIHVPHNHAAAAGLREAAAKVNGNAPAYPTATYHRLRLLMEAGTSDEARALLDELLPSIREAVPKTALNLFLGQRMRLARDLDEFLQFAPRHPVGRAFGIGESYANNLDESAPELLFDSDAVEIFNQGLPLTLLAQAANSSRLPEHLRRQLVMMTWVRAILLEENEVAGKLAGPLEGFYPELAEDLAAWRDTGNAVERRFLSALLLLRFPGLKPHLVTGLAMRTKAAGIENLRDNWWCAFSLEGGLDTYSMHRYYTSSLSRESAIPSAMPPAFLRDAERTQLDTEWKQLLDTDTAPNHLADVVTSYGREHPDDPRLPEALHLAVKSTRYGCTNAGTGRSSRAAFELLHRRFPDSQWTPKTPYWFK